MPSSKKASEKARLHPRNKNRERYQLTALLHTTPALADFVKPNAYGNDSIDFANPIAVKTLNKALLQHYYGIDYWDFPNENLCPPIPGRADYIHYIADLLADHNLGIIPTGDMVTCLDIGVGASCIYPIIGSTEYNWNFIGADIDPKSIAYSQNIADANPTLKSKVHLRLQTNPNKLFEGIIKPDDRITSTLCNPPFHASITAAEKGTQRKLKNLAEKEEQAPTRNFAGIKNELICKGGELGFIERMINQSTSFSKNCFWFTTLVSKKEHLRPIKKALKRVGVVQSKTIAMGTGNKISRIIAWTFLSEKEQLDWSRKQWSKNK